MSQNEKLNASKQKSNEQAKPDYWNRRKVLRTGLGIAVTSAVGTGVFLQSRRENTFATSTSTSSLPTIATQWINVALQAIRVTRPAPSVSARLLAIVSTCMYDAWVVYMPTAIGTRLGATLRHYENGHAYHSQKTIAVSFAAYRALVDLMPGQLPAFQAMMQHLGYNPDDTSTDTSTPVGVGNVVAKAVLDFRHHDGSNQLGDLNAGPYSDYTGYTPENTPDAIHNPNRWQPLSLPDGNGGVVIQKFATPQWGRVIPFALKEGSQFRPATGPAHFTTRAYKEQAQQILDFSAALDDREKAIVEYWKDGPASETPPGHWFLLAQGIAKRDKHTLDEDVQMYFMLGNALLDASIVAWDAKHYYNSVRPITAIRYLFKDISISAWGGPTKGTQTILGQNWLPYQPATALTPPFPEFFSGHSIFSATSAEILTLFSGRTSFDYSYTKAAGTSVIEPGVTPATAIQLHWNTLQDAANEAGLSRRYGGIHFEQGDLVGRALGKKVAALVWEKAFSYISGKEA